MGFNNNGVFFLVLSEYRKQINTKRLGWIQQLNSSDAYKTQIRQTQTERMSRIMHVSDLQLTIMCDMIAIIRIHVISSCYCYLFIRHTLVFSKNTILQKKIFVGITFCVSWEFYSTGKVLQLTCLIIWSIMFQLTDKTSKVEAWYLPDLIYGLRYWGFFVWTEKTPGSVQKVLIHQREEQTTPNAMAIYHYTEVKYYQCGFSNTFRLNYSILLTK